MAIASDAQVQSFVNGRVRPFGTLLVSADAQTTANIANLDDIFQALTQQNPTWVDINENKAPHTLTIGDVLVWNTYIRNLQTVLTGTTTDPAVALSLVQGLQEQWPVIQKLPIVPTP